MKGMKRICFIHGLLSSVIRIQIKNRLILTNELSSEDVFTRQCHKFKIFVNYMKAL